MPWWCRNTAKNELSVRDYRVESYKNTLVPSLTQRALNNFWFYNILRVSEIEEKNYFNFCNCIYCIISYQISTCTYYANNVIRNDGYK